MRIFVILKRLSVATLTVLYPISLNLYKEVVLY